MIQYPLQKLAEPSAAIFSDIENKANDLRIKRFEKQTQLLDALIKKTAEEEAKQDAIDAAQNNTDDSWIDVSEGMDKLLAPIKEWFIRMDFKTQKWTAEVLEATARLCSVEPMGVRTCVGAHERVRVGARARKKQRILAR